MAVPRVEYINKIVVLHSEKRQCLVDSKYVVRWRGVPFVSDHSVGNAVVKLVDGEPVAAATSQRILEGV